MANGLFLSVQEFNVLPNKAKLNCLYENQVRQLELMELQKKDYTKIKITQRIQYGAIFLIGSGLAFIFKHILGAA